MVKLPVDDRITFGGLASHRSNRSFEKLYTAAVAVCIAALCIATLPAADAITNNCLGLTLATCAEATPLIKQTPTNRPRSPRPPGKSLNRGGGGSVQAEDPFRFDLDSAVEVLADSTELDLYDPLTLSTLKRLKEDATPPYDPHDIDPVRTRHVVEKALAIQAGRTMANLLRSSDFRDFHRLVLKNLDFLHGLLTLSVSRGHDGLNAGRTPDGESLFAFNLRMSVRDGFDPQIRLSDSLRFRYDLGERQTLLEYGIGF